MVTKWSSDCAYDLTSNFLCFTDLQSLSLQGLVPMLLFHHQYNGGQSLYKAVIKQGLPVQGELDSLWWRVLCHWNDINLFIKAKRQCIYYNKALNLSSFRITGNIASLLLTNLLPVSGLTQPKGCEESTCSHLHQYVSAAFNSEGGREVTPNQPVKLHTQ